MTEKEIELDGWIKGRMAHLRMAPEVFRWVALDEDGSLCAYQELPRRFICCWGNGPLLGEWRAGEFAGETGIQLGWLAEDSRLWAWNEFLLEFLPLPEVAPMPLNLLFLEDEGGEPLSVWAERVLDQMEQHVSSIPESPALPLPLSPPPRSGPVFEREIWTASVMNQAMRLRVSIVEEALPSPLEHAHWRLPTDEELDMELPGGWTDVCPVEL